MNYPRIPQIAIREKGIRDGIAEFAPEAKVVAVASASSPAEGDKAVNEILKEHPAVKVVVGINDGGALGALKAFEDLRKVAPDVFIGGIDATPEAIEKIRDGTAYRCTVDVAPYNSGAIDMDFAKKLVEGKIVPNRFSIHSRLITTDNVSSMLQP